MALGTKKAKWHKTFKLKIVFLHVHKTPWMT